MHMAAEFGPRNGGFVFFLLKKNTGKTPWKVDDISLPVRVVQRQISSTMLLMVDL